MDRRSAQEASSIDASRAHLFSDLSVTLQIKLFLFESMIDA